MTGISIDRYPICFGWWEQLEPTVSLCFRQLDGDRITNYGNIGDGHRVTDYGPIKRNNTYLVLEYGNNTNHPQMSMEV